jgi:LPS-assembly lipoprotein
MPRAATLSCLLLSIALSGCGFQLRGAPSVPEAVQPLALKCASPVPEQLCRALKEQLAQGEVNLTDEHEAKAILQLSNFRQDRRASAVTARAAAAEYTLRQSVELQVISAKQTPLIANERVDSTLTYRYDETNVLAKQQEEDSLQDELSQNLARQVLFRLAPLNQTRLDLLEAAQ